jgi:serine/threonine-protein kinase RsbW
MQSSDYIELKIPAKPEFVGVVRLLISGVASRMGFSYDEIEDMKLAVAEACNNAATHAYKHQEGQMIIGCQSYEDRLEIIVIDHGDSFDISHVHQRVRPICREMSVEHLNEGGLGLFLIDTLMDKVEFSSDAGIMIMMTKYKQLDEVERDDQSFTTSPSR